MSFFQGWTIPVVDEATHQHLAAKTTELEQRLRDIATRFGDARFASSLAVEDMVITDVIARLGLNIQVFTLETGRLNPETSALIPATEARYGIKLRVMTPNEAAVSDYVSEHGRDAFYEGVDLRRECCRIRKIEPLNRAISGADAWLTGQRREQSATREELPFEEFDANHQIAKFNPIFDWHEADVWAYVEAHKVPVNALYQQHYPSIGCEPCTKPVRAGEDIRAGRWWWENKDTKECGLHK